MVCIVVDWAIPVYFIVCCSQVERFVAFYFYFFFVCTASVFLCCWTCASVSLALSHTHMSTALWVHVENFWCNCGENVNSGVSDGKKKSNRVRTYTRAYNMILGTWTFIPFFFLFSNEITIHSGYAVAAAYCCTFRHKTELNDFTRFDSRPVDRKSYEISVSW